MKPYKIRILESTIFSEDNILAGICRKMIFYLLGNRIKIKGHNNVINIRGLYFKSKIIINGNNNTINVAPRGVSKGIRIEMIGNDNNISIGEFTHFTGTLISCCDDNNVIIIGKDGNIGKSNICCMEGRKIIIGDGNLMSFDIEMRTSDGHSIFDEDGRRVNSSKDINIGENVWISQRCMIFKGTTIPNNVVIGANSLVNKPLDKSNSVYVGIPIRCIKEKITWKHEREN